jgi:selenide,water dikinase
VGSSTADDAGVYRISETEALIMSTDFFPPIVDDPYRFGQIAAANALSDIYAMGGKPLVGLNIACFPADMPHSLLSEILRGGQEKVQEAGALVIGGHTVKDKELKYGLAVTGRILIKDIKTNANAKPGDLLILTKPLGTGVISTALKNNQADEADVEFIMNQMSELNRIAAEIMVRHEANAATDITGFGLIGHMIELNRSSNVSCRIQSENVPLIPNALGYARGFIPGGLNDNRKTFEQDVDIKIDLDQDLETIFYDPQTSGGLLISAPPQKAEIILQELHSEGIESAALIGEVTEKRDNYIEIH